MCVNNNIKRGDIFYANLGDVKNTNGSEQGGTRPVIVIQNNMGNRFSPTVIVASITSKLNKAKLPTHVEIKKNKFNGLEKDSLILCEQIKTISKERLINYIGYATEITMKRIDKAINVSVNFDKEKEMEFYKENSDLINTVITLKKIINIWLDKTGSMKEIEHEIQKCKELENQLKKNDLFFNLDKFQSKFSALTA